MKNTQHIFILLLIAAITQTARAQEVYPEGQAIGWTTLNPTDPFQVQSGLRYLPGIKFAIPAGNLSIEGELSADTWFSGTYPVNDSLSFDHTLAPYRAWVKLSGNQFELRAGLQKINFGSARMIRPLMWFDRMDPKDPLQLTSGVYGLLGRYYFLNNANIWAWALYGNNETKGLEIVPSVKNSFEYGGRVQLPVPIGEIAFTYHHRNSDPDAMLPPATQTDEPLPENRFAFDTRLNMVVGAWFEGALIRKNDGILPLDNTTLLNAGLDYTFNLGNGLNISGEGLYYMQGTEAFQADQDVLFGGVSVNYPLNIIHDLSLMVFMDAMNNEFYRFLNWSMTFDKWTFYTLGFWNPETYLLPGFEQKANMFSGAGVQFMAVFNH
ncbi:MAG TPA: hypothetical protein VJ951_06675 [Bacteroidales bacterium]|nr:hypothetical protein [Bacteroidales bacterium]